MVERCNCHGPYIVAQARLPWPSLSQLPDLPGCLFLHVTCGEVVAASPASGELKSRAFESQKLAG